MDTQYSLLLPESNVAIILTHETGVVLSIGENVFVDDSEYRIVRIVHKTIRLDSSIILLGSACYLEEVTND